MNSLSDSSPLLLASGSPRRRELLASVGVPLIVRAPSVDETSRDGELAHTYLERITESKAAAARASRGAREAGFLVADTVVILDQRILGKPKDAAEAREMVTQLAGRTHEVATRFWLERELGAEVAQTVRTEVTVKPLSSAVIERYVATGEGLDKAGAYAVQGLFAFAIQRLVGSYTNVVGLPLTEVVDALEVLGLITGYP